MEIIVKTTHENEDLISFILYENGATGLEIQDPKDIDYLQKNKDTWDFIDDDVMNYEFEGVLIKAYFTVNSNVEKIIGKLKEKINSLELGEVLVNKVDEKDWAENWKIHYKTEHITDNIVIKPSWEIYAQKSNELVIELDPGMAFGTGSHETTIMCARSLEKYIDNSKVVFDIGCGSGILSIVSARLGAKSVLAIDLDPMCVKVTKENVEINGLSDKIKTKTGNLFDVIDGKADIIVANIIAEIIVGMIPDIKEYLNKDGVFIASGIIESKLPIVQKALHDNGYTIIDILQINGWVAITSK
ncbi:MAG: 50S ribosomal protein L11 methyltransferase [Gudongella sp.]|nr:50S ribosomal protein L11 methyltransferase [Gudongella sp.]